MAETARAETNRSARPHRAPSHQPPTAAPPQPPSATRRPAVAHTGHRQRVPSLMSVPGFEMALGCTLDLWSGVRTGVTLFAVSWLLPAPSEVEGTAAAALSPLGSVGRLPDRRIGLAYVEPRGSGEDLHPDTLHRIVQSRLERCLTDAGWHRFAWAMRLASARGWTDDVDSPAALIARLPVVEPPLSLARL